MSVWPQCTMLYDGSFAGFLTCVGDSFRRKEYPCYFLTPKDSRETFYPLREIPTDPALAKSVYRLLREKISPSFQQLVAHSFLTCLPQKERAIFDVVYLSLLGALEESDGRILILSRGVDRLIREMHIWEDSIRLQNFGGILAGELTPENRVLPLLRYSLDQKQKDGAFLLYDRTHQEALLYLESCWKLCPVPSLELSNPRQATLQLQALCRNLGTVSESILRGFKSNFLSEMAPKDLTSSVLSAPPPFPESL